MESGEGGGQALKVVKRWGRTEMGGPGWGMFPGGGGRGRRARSWAPLSQQGV